MTFMITNGTEKLRQDFSANGHEKAFVVRGWGSDLDNQRKAREIFLF